MQCMKWMFLPQLWTSLHCWISHMRHLLVK
jgi:hypothetical protein